MSVKKVDIQGRVQTIDSRCTSVVRAFHGLHRSLNRPIYHRQIRLHRCRACLGRLIHEGRNVADASMRPKGITLNS